MDDIFSLIFFLWVAFTLFEGIGRKKRNQLPPTIDQQQQDSESTTFEIPKLANDPHETNNQPQTTEVVEVEQVNQVEQIFKQRQELIRRRMAEATQQAQLTQTDTSSHAAQPKSRKQTQMPVNLTPDTAINAFIFAEIFDKPKALRKRS